MTEFELCAELMGVFTLVFVLFSMLETFSNLKEQFSSREG